MHRSQGFGGFGGGGGGGGSRGAESFTLLAGEPATKDIFDGVDTTWARVPGGAEIAKLADEAVAKFDVKDPAASVPALLAIRKQVASLTSDPVVAEKKRQLDRVIQGCLGLVVETTVPRAEVVPGEVLAMHHVVSVTSSVPVRWLSVSYPLTGQTAAETIDAASRPAGHARREADAARRNAAEPAVLAARRSLRWHVPGPYGRADRASREPAGVPDRASVPGRRGDDRDRRRARAGRVPGRAGPAAGCDRAGVLAVAVRGPAVRAGRGAQGGGRGHGRARRRGGDARSESAGRLEGRARVAALQTVRGR